MNGVHLTIDLAAPIARVWKHLTDRDKLAVWLMANDLSPETGARSTFTAPPSGTWDGKVHCGVTEVVEHERLAFTWNANDIGAETLVTFMLEEIPAGTRLTLTHAGFEAARPGAEGKHAAGWTRALAAFENAMCGPRAGYDWSVIRITRHMEAPLADVFALWSTAAGLASFWADGVTCTGAGTLLHLRQSGMRDDPEDRVQGSLNCRCCWIYFLMALKGQLEHGVDLRDPRPATADSIAVGYDPGS